MRALARQIKELFNVPALHEENARLMKRIGELEIQLDIAMRNQAQLAKHLRFGDE